MQNRFRSITLWLAIAALIAFISKVYIGYEIPQFDKFVDLLLVVLAGLGVVNNPVDPNKF